MPTWRLLQLLSSLPRHLLLLLVSLLLLFLLPMLLPLLLALLLPPLLPLLLPLLLWHPRLPRPHWHRRAQQRVRRAPPHPVLRCERAPLGDALLPVPRL
jgi:hypothetical protein